VFHRDAAIKLQTWFLVPAAGNSNAPKRGKEPHAEISAGKEPEAQPLSNKNSQAVGESESNQPLAFELKIDYSHPYLKERGLTEATVRTFGVGLFSGSGTMHDRIVTPIHNEKGELVAYAGRSIDGSEPR
jgi:hypothetical protein